MNLHFIREGKTQMRRSKPKTSKKNQAPPEKDEDKERMIKYLGNLEELHADGKINQFTI